MGRLILAAAAMFVLLVGTITAQTKVTTADDYARLMKSTAQAGAAMNKALIVDASYPDARKLLVQVRQNYVTLQQFWGERKRSDALAIVKDGLAQIDAMDKLLQSNAEIPLVQKASENFGSTCASCHMLYREGTRETGFRFKEGVL